MHAVLSEVEKLVPHGELVATTEHVTLWMKCRTNQGQYNRVQLQYHSLCDTLHTYIHTYTFCKSKKPVKQQMDMIHISNIQYTTQYTTQE